jgi:colanic acid biosynthesis protein WcaH
MIFILGIANIPVKRHRRLQTARPPTMVRGPLLDRSAMSDSLSDRDFAALARLGPLVAIDFLLRDPAGACLVGLRANAPAKGTWFVPGGCIRKNERRAEAFARILKTETGLEYPFAQARLVGAYDHLYPDNRFGDPGFNTHYVVLAYTVALTGRPEIRCDNQHSVLRWMSPVELLADPDVHANTKAYFQAVP